MQPSDRGNAADYADREAAEMGRILVLGAALGVPMVLSSLCCWSLPQGHAEPERSSWRPGRR